MRRLTRSAWFWIAYALLALGALGVAASLFPVAIPLVNLEIGVARHEAIAKAQAMAVQLGLAPAGTRVAAQFSNDGELQNYVELEGGGKRAFAALVAGDRYSPYWWSVRLFRPGVVDEATVMLRPDGAPNGFVRRVAEDYVRKAATQALSPDAARALAEERAHREWRVDLSRYRLLQQSQQTRASGRVDHVFVYEQPEPVGSAHIRLRLGVAGDELVEVSPHAKVPESFERRYAELRSANNLVAGIADAAAGLVYGLGGCVVGVLWLLRERKLLWRPALRAGFLVAALLAGAVLASYPERWMSFDTANDASLFWVRHVALGLAVLVGGGLALALVFMAAEGLARRAFPEHPQLWQLWSREGGASLQVAGRTAGGMLFVPLELAYVVLFYYATNRFLGWWQPSEALTDPNILSSAIPALQPIALALQAGFMEECLFRAVPLSLGALIGERFGRRRAGIVVAVVLQAVVFGGAHANYPGFPAYSRLAELVAPSIAWAIIFLRFGLLPTILLHALFDLVLMSIPLFLVDAPGAALQRMLVIAAGAVPVLVVGVRRLQLGAFGEMPASLRNAAWHAAQVATRPADVASSHPSRWRSALRDAVPALALAGLVAWGLAARVGTDVPPLAIGRADAIGAAEKALAARGAALGPDWRRSAEIAVSGSTAAQAFVWREAGPARYRELVGTFLPPPAWQVRFARFDGDVADRAEEWRASVDGRGHVRVVTHTLPEGRAGARLARDDALAVAARAVRTELGLDAGALQLVGARDQERPARTDWTFVWQDPRTDVGKGGEARVQATVNGDEATGVGRYVHVPEAWERAERQREQWLNIAKLAAAVVVAMASLAALVVGVLAWSRGHADRRAMVLVASIVVAAGAARVALSWPLLEFGLVTTEPVATQVALKTVAGLLGVLVLALVSAVLAGVGAWWARHAPRPTQASRLPPWAVGAAAALAIAGIALMGSHWLPDLVPAWPSYPFEDTAVPMLAAALQPLRVPAAIGVVLFALAALAHVTRDGGRHAWILPLLAALAFGEQALDAGTLAPLPIATALAMGALAGALVDAVLRTDPRTVPAFVVTGALMVALDSALAKATMQGYALFAIQAAVTLFVGGLCARYLAVPPASPSAPAPD